MTAAKRYGYRVYTLGVGIRNSWRNAEDMSALGPEVIDRTHENLKAAKGALLKYRPNLGAGDGSIILPEDGDAGQPVMVISDVWRFGSLIRCEVVAGTYGDHDELVGEGIEPITDRAAGRRYRFDFYFPRSGQAGMLVAETCKRVTPVEDFLRWVAWLDLEALKQRAAFQATQWEAGGSTGEAVIDPTRWRKFRAYQVADRNFLLQLIKNADRINVELVDAGHVTKRGIFKEISKRLTFVDVGEGVHESLLEEVAKWLEPHSSTKGVVKRILGALSLDEQKLENDGLSFNNTSIQLHATQTVSVTPTTVKDLFTYGLSSEVRLDNSAWEMGTRGKLVELAAMEQIDLDL